MIYSSSRISSCGNRVSNIKNFLLKLNAVSEKFADRMSDVFGHPLFLLANMIVWLVWIGGGLEDAPYGDLTLLVSLEAIFMSILILNSSTRKGHEDTRLMIKDINMGKDMQQTIDHLQDDLEELHENIEEIKDILDDEK